MYNIGCLTCSSVQVYSKELCQLLRSLLRRAYHQRPTTRCVYVVCVCVCIYACVALCCGVSAGVSPSELVKEPFVQECLSLSDSPLCEAKERGEEAPINGQWRGDLSCAQTMAIGLPLKGYGLCGMSLVCVQL